MSTKLIIYKRMLRHLLNFVVVRETAEFKYDLNNQSACTQSFTRVNRMQKTIKDIY